MAAPSRTPAHSAPRPVWCVDTKACVHQRTQETCRCTTHVLLCRAGDDEGSKSPKHGTRVRDISPWCLALARLALLWMEVKAGLGVRLGVGLVYLGGRAECGGVGHGVGLGGVD